MADVRVDTIIRGGQIVTSSQVYESSIAISGEKIAAIGPPDAQALPVTDGFADFQVCKVTVETFRQRN